jgi:hypothetical protein
LPRPIFGKGRSLASTVFIGLNFRIDAPRGGAGRLTFTSYSIPAAE